MKWSRYRPGVAQRVGRGIALLFHDRSTRRGWVFSSTPRPLFTPGKDPVPIAPEAGWAPGPIWMGGKSRPHRDSISDCPARSQSLYRLSYRAHIPVVYITLKDSIGQNTTGLLAGCSCGVVLMKHVSVYLEAIIRFTNVSYRRLITMRGMWQMFRGGGTVSTLSALSTLSTLSPLPRADFLLYLL